MVGWLIALEGRAGTDIISKSSGQILDVLVVMKAGIGSMKANVDHIIMHILKEVFVTV